MKPITSEQNAFMTFPTEGEEHDILFLKNGTPSPIGVLPASISEEELPEVLKLLDKIYILGLQQGERSGRRDAARNFRQLCDNIEQNNR